MDSVTQRYRGRFGKLDGVGPKALSVAGKPPRSDNILYNAGNLNPIRVLRLESRSDKSVSLLVRAWSGGGEGLN